MWIDVICKGNFHTQFFYAAFIMVFMSNLFFAENREKY